MENIRRLGLERALLALFVLSGFAGLIYQAIWSHYLGLSLGHAAYAQTLVLAIFMGGMALGAWLVSRFGVHWRRLIFAYAIVEIVIGLAGLGFHFAFLHYTDLTQQVIYPALDSAVAVRTWQWGSAALLIFPQCVLLGMTFPLMSGGYLRVAPRADGEILGGLYFTNSIGAAFGALVATFLLLPWVGMPGTVAVAGFINLLVGVLAWLVSRRADVDQPVAASATAASRLAASTPASSHGPGFYGVMLAAACITGATSFVYEIGWIRLLNQALGTTVHSFELMLSAFIFGLAFGGWWIRRRSQSIEDPVSYAGYAQIWMGLAALLSLPVFSQSFRWVGALMAVLPKDDFGYQLFMFGSAGIALLVMFPAAFFAGMTLPLFTMALLRSGSGEAGIGRVYAANTLGAILGVAVMVHVLIPAMGIRLSVTLAALIDIGLGVYLIKRWALFERVRLFAGALVCTLVVVAISLVLGKPDPLAQASGVFRHGSARLDAQAQMHYMRDGKTATVAFFSQGTSATIATNGKPDASIQLDPTLPPAEDEITMIMAGALPLMAHPNPERVAIIGWGSGLSTHTVLGSPAPKVVDSIEIEKAMYDGARLYGRNVERAYADPRSVIHIDDARTFFSTGQRKYDVILSEPSNPWISGVASLFTQQFYRFMRNHLNEGGVVVQWIQAYEISERLFSVMMAAFIEEFPYVDVYMTNSGDLLFLASQTPLSQLDYARVAMQPLGDELARVGLAGPGDFQVRKVGNRASLAALVELFGATPHSDFHPVVSLQAPRDRFQGRSVSSFSNLQAVGMPVLEAIGVTAPPVDSPEVRYTLTSPGAMAYWNARFVRAMMQGETWDGPPIEPELKEQVERLLGLSSSPVAEADIPDWLGAVSIAADYSVGYFSPAGHGPTWVEPEWIQLDEQPILVREVMAAYSAASRRDTAQMRTLGSDLLGRLPAEGSPLMREQMLMIATLGAILEDDFGGAAAIEETLGSSVTPVNPFYGFSRTYLRAWIAVNSNVSIGG